MINYEYGLWESIDDDLFAEANAGELVSVSKDEEYIGKMKAQNIKVRDFLQAKYPERTFRVSKWHSHDFGSYQEVEEMIGHEDDREDFE